MTEPPDDRSDTVLCPTRGPAAWKHGAAALLTALILCGPCISAAAVPGTLDVGDFSAARPGGQLPPGWRPLRFPGIGKHTRYTLVQNGGQVVIRAQADASASGLVREVHIDPRVYPVLRWRWKITGVLAGTSLSRKDGDDAMARLYITFAYDPARLGPIDRLRYEAARLVYGSAPPLRALTYLWTGAGRIGAWAPNPSTDRVMMQVLETGGSRVGQWVTEERNLYQDYRRAFGEDPPMISGVAIMTDTDNTGGRTVSYYGDIRFEKPDAVRPTQTRSNAPATMIEAGDQRTP
ncbi:MAG: hypothetical protein B7Z66_03445 [Chromatiales bacterium 21-64-14]|nr:MAG: hypothetical protein B7Z66_03445 [Chromatiales bacterium 21-64-14]HQU15806.1 DUF3047 domain-containing protein [Gammaproteobacteria bacterium]